MKDFVPVILGVLNVTVFIFLFCRLIKNKKGYINRSELVQFFYVSGKAKQKISLKSYRKEEVNYFETCTRYDRE